jgi:hypothetical protein
MFERTFGQYTRVLVDMDLTQTLRSKVLVERKGFAFFVDLDYENLPDFCTHCKMVGHYVEICKKLQNQDNTTGVAEPKLKSKTRVVKKYVQDKAVVVQDKVTEVVDVSKHPAEGLKSQPTIVADHVGESSNHTPQVIVEVDSVNVEHQNKFNILSTALEDSDESNNSVDNVEDQLEENEDKNDSDSSTQDSVFVDATQFQKDDTTNVVAEPLVINQPVATPVRVQNDIVFLKESWANMVDLEEHENFQAAASEAAAASVDEQHLSDAGFQLKLSKNQKKAQKKATHSGKESYATRSKVNQKPFK